jgi:hypothetical protein
MRAEKGYRSGSGREGWLEERRAELQERMRRRRNRRQSSSDGKLDLFH